MTVSVKRTYDTHPLPTANNLKVHVSELVVGDTVLIEDEFGEYSFGVVERFSVNKKNVKINGMFFNVESGSQIAYINELKTVVVGRYLPDKRIHLGNGTLFTKEESQFSHQKRSHFRDRLKLIDQIIRASPNDWLLFSDQELVDLVKRLFRLNHITLNVIPKPYDTNNETDNEAGSDN